MKRIASSLLFTLLLTVSACAPNFGVRLSVPSLPDPQSFVAAPVEGESVRVKVGSFVDARPSMTILVVDGRDVVSEGSLGSVVQDGFQRYFREAGARVTLINAPLIEGEITNWSAKVTPGFPSSDAVASARIRVTIKDSEFHPLYRANFSGEATISHPLLDEEMVQELLARAMGGAIEAAIKDESLIAQLSRGRVE